MGSTTDVAIRWKAVQWMVMTKRGREYVTNFYRDVIQLVGYSIHVRVTQVTAEIANTLRRLSRGVHARELSIEDQSVGFIGNLTSVGQERSAVKQ